VKPTHSRHDLSLHSVLVLEAGSKVRDPSTTIARHIGDATDAVKHVAAGEQQDRDKADGGPDIAVLDDGEHIWPSNNGSSDGAGQHHSGEDPLDPVDRALDGRVRAVGEVTAEPGMDLLGALRAVR
jgi:hypothetical protein